MKFYFAQNTSGQFLTKDMLWIDTMDHRKVFFAPSPEAIRAVADPKVVGVYGVHTITDVQMAAMSKPEALPKLAALEEVVVGALRGLDPARHALFTEGYAKLVAEHRMPFQPHASYSVVGDRLQVYLTEDSSVAVQITPNITVLKYGHTIVGVKVVGLLELMSPRMDPSVKAMMVPLDCVVAMLERYDNEEHQGELSAEEIQFVQMADHHWPTLRERFPWMVLVKPTEQVR